MQMQVFHFIFLQKKIPELVSVGRGDPKLVKGSKTDNAQYF